MTDEGARREKTFSEVPGKLRVRKNGGTCQKSSRSKIEISSINGREGPSVGNIETQAGQKLSNFWRV